MKKLLLALALFITFVAGMQAQETVTDVITTATAALPSGAPSTPHVMHFVSDAVYTGRVYPINTKGTIGLNGNNQAALYTSESGGTVVSVEIQVTSNTVYVYGRTAAEGPFSGEELFYTSPLSCGTLLATVTGTKTITPDEQYAYIAFSSTNGSIAQFKSVSVTWEPTPEGTTAAPKLTPGTDTYIGGTSVSMSCSTEGAAIYYTLDGSEPTEASTLYTEPMDITRTTSVRAIAVAEGLEPSQTSQAEYTIKCADPQFSVEDGEYTKAQSVVITAVPSDASIYYTLDGSEPTQASTRYTEPVEIAQTAVLKAVCIKEGCEPSAVTSVRIAIVPFLWDILTDGLTSEELDLPQSITPISYSSTDSPAVYEGNLYNSLRFGNSMAFNGNSGANGGLVTTTSGGIIKSIQVTMLRGMRVYINNDGSYTDSYFNDRELLVYGRTLEEGPYESSADLYDPEKQGTLIGRCGNPEKKLAAEVYTFEPKDQEYAYIGFASSYLVCFVPAIKVDWKTTPHVMTPEFTPAPGEYDDTQSVTITCDTPDATIYYTLDGTEPTEESPVYDGSPIVVTQSKTIKAMAVAEPLVPSYVATGEYTINRVVKYVRVTDVDELREGNDVIVVAADAPIALSTTQYTNNRGITPVTLNDDASMLTNPSDDVQIITLGRVADNWVLQSGVEAFLSAEQSKNYLVEQPTALEASYTALSIDADGNAVIEYPFMSRFLRYNDDLEVFSTYAFGAQAPVMMYVEDHSGDPSYVARPVASVLSGLYYGDFEVALKGFTDGTTLYYTLDGTEPTITSIRYEAPIRIDATTTLKAVAVMDEYKSKVLTAIYNVVPSSAITDVEIDDAVAPVYYNLQGVRINHAAPGQVVIEVCGGNARTIITK